MGLKERNRKVAISRWQKELAKQQPPQHEGAQIAKAAICGFLAGDGSVIIRQSKKGQKRYDLKFYPDDLVMLKVFQRYIKGMYKREVKWTLRDNIIQVQMTSKSIVKDLQALAKHGSSDWTLPGSLTKVPGAKQAWLRAFFSAEAYVGKRQIKVQTINEKGMLQVSSILEEIGIPHKVYRYSPKKKNHKKVTIISIHSKRGRQLYLKKVGFWHYKKSRKLSKTLAL